MEVRLKPGIVPHEIGTRGLHGETSKVYVLYDVFEGESEVVEIWIPELENIEAK